MRKVLHLEPRSKAVESIASPPAQAASQPAAEDVRLVAAVLKRDRKATAEFVQQYSDSIYAYVRHRLIPRTDLVDDLVQDIFLAAWKSLQNFRGQSSLRAWLMGIARHKIEDHYRGVLRATIPIEEDWDGAAPGSAEPFEDALDRTRREVRVDRTLATLPETYRLALLWRYWERRPAKDIAEQIGKSEKAVERLLARARAQFKRSWNHE